MIPVRIRVVSHDECPICGAAATLVATGFAAKPGSNPFLDARSMAITSMIVGWRREAVELCATCKEIAEKASDQIEAMQRTGRAPMQRIRR